MTANKDDEKEGVTDEPSPENVDKKKKCFVMMPFSTPKGYEDGHFDYIYEQIIEKAIEKAGYEALRVDKDLKSTDIVQKIFKGIAESEMAICDLSSNNPNVFYELGIRQSYNKPVLLIRDDETKPMFDISGLTTIEYKKLRLFENVEAAIEKIHKGILDNEENTSIMISDLIKIDSIPSDNNDTIPEKDIKMQTIINMLQTLLDKTDEEVPVKVSDKNIYYKMNSSDIEYFKNAIRRNYHLFNNIEVYLENDEVIRRRIDHAGLDKFVEKYGYQRTKREMMEYLSYLKKKGIERST
ncbi:MAG: hypothetical protein ACK5LC_14045 [Coprobacillaceae bacterium]